MYCFNSDYTEGCHPAILEKLVATNMEQTTGYGMDATNFSKMAG
jgi:threonine aldolase